MSLIAELKRRNVFRVGVAYVIGAWVIAQVADLVLDNIEAPDWVMQAIMLVLAIGLPLALILAWAFELTPDGVKREKDVDRSQSITQQTGRKLDFAIIGLLAIGVVYFAVDKFALQAGPERASVEREKSIAVLPFDNISPNPEDAYFAEGIHDEVLAQLSKIRDLKVISRTSVMGYRGESRPPLPEIAAALGVANILEGSVRLAGNRVRITTQLIEAESDTHLWTETYDRDLENIFEIQSDVAQQIASALRAKLTATERVRIEKKPTENLRAYNLYLLGRHHSVQRPATQDSLDAAAAYFQQAIDEDPAFGAAYEELSTIHWLRVTLGASMELEFEKLRHLAEIAIALDPDGGQANSIMAWVHAWDGDLQAADARMARVLELAPSAAGSYRDNASWFRPVDDRIAYARIAIKLDPLDLGASSILVQQLIEARRFTEAAEAAESAYALDRDGAVLALADAYFFADRKEEAREAYARALELYGSLERSSDTIAELAYINGMLGREEQARALLRELEGMSQDGHVYHVSAARAYASIGDSDRTLHWIERGIEEERNWYWFPVIYRPLFDFLRADPRYSEVLGRANPEFRDRFGFER
jgi:TolB-like protein